MIEFGPRANSRGTDALNVIARTISRRHLEIACAYLAGYVLFDWLSYVQPFGAFGITPWNPHTGLSFALILLFGVEFLPWLFVAPVLADLIVRGFVLPPSAEIWACIIIGGSYAAGTTLLLSTRFHFDVGLVSRQSLVSLLTVAIFCAALVSVGYVGMLVLLGVLPGVDFGRAALRFWIGDVIGITVLTPFALLLAARRLIRPSWEALALVVILLGALGFVFGSVDTLRFQLFYLFFLPVVWAAVRFGLEGVSAALVVTQVGLITAIHYTEQTDVTAYQALMVVLSLTGLAVGALVSEQRRTHQQLQLNQEALNRALRVSTMGEFAAALAHEINQPLTAVANYARLAKHAPNPEAAAEASNRVIVQVDRAAEVIRRLRDFIRLGRNDTMEIDVQKLIHAAVSYCTVGFDKYGIDLRMRVARDLPKVKVDPLQIEQVMVNLVRNAAEALSDAGRYDGKVMIDAEREDRYSVVVRVRDNGPGFDLGLAERAVAPFITTKAEGLGLGLSLARSIVEAHGGRLAIDSTSSGAVVSFTLPAVVDSRSPHDNCAD